MQHLKYRMSVLHMLGTLSHEECRTRNLSKSAEPDGEVKNATAFLERVELVLANLGQYSFW